MAERKWAGSTLSARQDERRRRLLDAGLDLLGDAEPSALGVRAVCRHARLTERYFYESFADRDALVAAVFAEVGEQAHRVLVEAAREAAADLEALAEAAVAAFVELILDDPRKGRVLLLVPLRDPALMARGSALLPAFRELVAARLPGDEVERRMASIALVGALTQLFTAVLDGTLDVPRDRLVGHCVRMLLQAARPATPGR